MTMFPKARSVIARIGLGIAIWLGALGQFITFIPGGGADWFGAALVLAALGLLSPSWRNRTVALVLIVVFARFAWLGYEHGQRYQVWLSQHPLTALTEVGFRD